MEKNVGLLLGGVAVAGVVAFLSLAPAGSDSGSTPAPTVSSAPAVTATAQPVDQSTATAPTQSNAPVTKSAPASTKAVTATNNSTPTQLGTARGGGDDDGHEGRQHESEYEDD